ncbi:hypothetical protein [Niveibacterium terrae]|uniref:hypothetical protein n=1 Tax=Niveibacterium terrae TaxID=3373598 RepID=UPI003A9132B0
MNDEALDVIEVRAGRAYYIFGGVFAANDGYYAEIHEQKNGRIRRVARSLGLPSREVAVAWMKSQDCFAHAA